MVPDDPSQPEFPDCPLENLVALGSPSHEVDGPRPVQASIRVRTYDVGSTSLQAGCHERLAGQRATRRQKNCLVHAESVEDLESVGNLDGGPGPFAHRQALMDIDHVVEVARNRVADHIDEPVGGGADASDNPGATSVSKIFMNSSGSLAWVVNEDVRDTEALQLREALDA